MVPEPLPGKQGQDEARSERLYLLSAHRDPAHEATPPGSFQRQRWLGQPVLTSGKTPPHSETWGCSQGLQEPFPRVSGLWLTDRGQLQHNCPNRSGGLGAS